MHSRNRENYQNSFPFYLDISIGCRDIRTQSFELVSVLRKVQRLNGMLRFTELYFFSEIRTTFSQEL